MVNFRKTFFFIIDYLKGSPIRKHLNDLEQILNHPNNNNSEIETRKQKMLHHALSNVPYYSYLLNQKEYLNIGHFPVINKNIIRENIDSFIANGKNKSELTRVVTSGSTGTPFAVYHDNNKKKRNTADTIHFGKNAGYTLGDKMFYLKIWNIVNRKKGLTAWLQNIVAYDVTQLSDERINELSNTLLNDQSYKGMIGYTSALEAICRYLDKNASEKKVKNVTAIIGMSEAMNDYTKVALKKHFKVDAVSRYSNVENGIIAQQMPAGNGEFIINWASYYIEILKIDVDETANYGEPGRIVITDFYNFAMPMIRYDTGDIGVLNWNDKKDKLVLSKVEGRKMDMVFDTSGNLVSSFTITNNMWLYPEIIQYQFIQKTKTSYHFKLNLNVAFERENELIEEFKKYFGQDASITVEYVKEIPLLNSGKRKKVLNLSN